MPAAAKKILLPRLVVTEVVDADTVGAETVQLPITGQIVEYHARPKHLEGDAERTDGKPRWMGSRFNLFPVVLDASGAPWAEAVVYLLSRLESAVAPAMGTYSSIADDLAAYRRFLDESGLDWTQFPAYKLNRPTYRYNGFLRTAVGAGEIAVSTAKRRMSAVIAFYTWLREEGVLVPEHAPWKESDVYIQIKDSHGRAATKQVTTTDLSIRVPQQSNPYAGTIDDGGKLRPLTTQEQEWVLKALLDQGNTEMTLIHLFGFLTGARLQTILTLRVRHALLELDGITAQELRFPVGPGTGIDTKHDKKMVLHIPVWFYRMLQTYAVSERAQHRRRRAPGGDTEDQHLFLSVRGAPLYQSKAAAASYDENNTLRHNKTGQGVQQFVVERVIPYVRKHFDPNFRYHFHDTRASFGMNLTDHQLKLVAAGEITLLQAREFVKTRMGHESSATTDLYLQYRDNLKQVRWAADGYECHLQALAAQAMDGSL